MIAWNRDARPELVWHHYSSVDADWHPAANPMMPDWPQLLLTSVLFEPLDGQTNVRLSQVPLDATDAEIACFAEMKDNMGAGYTVIDGVLQSMQT